jgi:tRNA-Thr(GGU) m(6)t(6)A37 methyltransferase TsaA
LSADNERLAQQHNNEPDSAPASSAPESNAPEVNAVHLTPVATIRSCYPERFGVPRQSGLVKSARASIVMPNTDFNRLSIRGLEAFSHLWIVFVFHQQRYQRAKPLVNPPRLGGKTSIGVFATRSPNRPNPIGLSAVEMINIEASGDELLIHIKSGDFLDGTPVIDIKPYVPFVDALPHAHSDWAPQAEPTLPVIWHEDAARARDDFAASHTALPALIPVIEETIALDPRPAYERRRDGAVNQSWGMRISRYNIRWQVIDGTAIIVSIDC